MIIGRQKLKKSFQYEIKWRNLDHRYNAWIPRERLIELGFSKIVQQFDDFEVRRVAEDGFAARLPEATGGLAENFSELTTPGLSRRLRLA